VEVEAVLDQVTGRRLEFAVRVAGGDRPVARGRVIRVVVETAGFLGQAAADAGAR
jgi:predicted thioesterase